MEVGDWGLDQNPISLGPDFALSAESRVKTVILKITATPERGKLLGTYNQFGERLQKVT